MGVFGKINMRTHRQSWELNLVAPDGFYWENGIFTQLSHRDLSPLVPLFSLCGQFCGDRLANQKCCSVPWAGWSHEQVPK